MGPQQVIITYFPIRKNYSLSIFKTKFLKSFQYHTSSKGNLYSNKNKIICVLMNLLYNHDNV